MFSPKNYNRTNFTGIFSIFRNLTDPNHAFITIQVNQKQFLVKNVKGIIHQRSKANLKPMNETSKNLSKLFRIFLAKKKKDKKKEKRGREQISPHKSRPGKG